VSDADWLEAMERDFPLHGAVARGDLSAVQRLLQAGVDLEQRDDTEWTPLMWAIDSAIVAALLDAGAEARMVTSSGETALMALARRGLR
jgi:ankyrin repeat protein